jgi:hypothetical protein
MHITREEEKALKITKEFTDAWREEHDIPCTEGLLEMIQARSRLAAACNRELDLMW